MKDYHIKELSHQETYDLKKRYSNGQFIELEKFNIPDWINTKNLVGIYKDVIYVYKGEDK